MGGVPNPHRNPSSSASRGVKKVGCTFPHLHTKQLCVALPWSCRGRRVAFCPPRVEKAEVVAVPLCFMLGRKDKGGGVARVGGTGCVYQALFLSPYLGISFISHPCDLQIGALVAGALIHLVWCHVCVQPPGRGLEESAPRGTQPPLHPAQGCSQLSAAWSWPWSLMVSSGGESHRGRRRPTLQRVPLTPKRLCQRTGGSLCNLFQRRWRPAAVHLQLETEPKEMGLDCSRWGDLGWRQTIRKGFVAGGWLSGLLQGALWRGKRVRSGHAWRQQGQAGADRGGL